MPLSSHLAENAFNLWYYSEMGWIIATYMYYLAGDLQALFAVCSRTMAKQERSGRHGSNFWHRDELHIFITGNEVEKIMFKLFLFVGEACCFVRYSPVPVVWMPIQESLLTLYISLFHYTLRKLWNNFCLNHLNEPFPDIKGFAHLHSMSQETHDQTRPGSLSLSLSLSLSSRGREEEISWGWGCLENFRCV